MKEFSGPIIQEIASATAWTGPGKPRGCGSASDSIRIRSGSESISSRAASVSTIPGATTLRGTPVPAQSSVAADCRTQRFSAIFEER
jgi:hypothetical protein